MQLTLGLAYSTLYNLHAHLEATTPHAYIKYQMFYFSKSFAKFSNIIKHAKEFFVFFSAHVNCQDHEIQNLSSL